MQLHVNPDFFFIHLSLYFRLFLSCGFVFLIISVLICPWITMTTKTDHLDYLCKSERIRPEDNTDGASSEGRDPI